MNFLFVASFAVVSFTSACAVSAFRDGVRQSPPWKETSVYSVDEKNGTLLKSRAWTPESTDYLAYSILHVWKEGDSCRENFAKGFVAYEPRKDPVRPFSLVLLLPPQEIIDIMETFPFGRGMLDNGTSANDSERYIPLRNDSYTPYWRRFDRMLAMVQSEGRIYFFPDRKEKSQKIPWDGEGKYKLEKVSNFPDRRGLLRIRARMGGDQGKIVYLNLDPATGKSFSLPAGTCCPAVGGLEEFSWTNPVRIDPDTEGFKDSMRWGCSFEAARSAGRGKGAETVRQIWRGPDLGEDIIVMDGKVWLSRGDNAVLLYPEPWRDSLSCISVTLESRGSSVPGDMDFMLTLKNVSGKPVKLEQGWGGVILRFSCDGHFTNNSLFEGSLEPFVPGWGLAAEDGLPAQTLEPGESTSALIRYSCPDWRIFPRDAHVFVKATFSTSGPVGMPGHGIYTSAPIKVSNPVPPSL